MSVFLWALILSLDEFYEETFNQPVWAILGVLGQGVFGIFRYFLSTWKQQNTRITVYLSQQQLYVSVSRPWKICCHNQKVVHLPYHENVSLENMIYICSIPWCTNKYQIPVINQPPISTRLIFTRYQNFCLWCKKRTNTRSLETSFVSPDFVL